MPSRGVGRTAKQKKTRLPDGFGLFLQLTPSATEGTVHKSWIFRCSVRDKDRQLGLGAYPRVSLAQVRVEAERYRGLLNCGIDPIEERERERLAVAAAVEAERIFASLPGGDTIGSGQSTSSAPSIGFSGFFAAAVDVKACANYGSKDGNVFALRKAK